MVELIIDGFIYNARIVHSVEGKEIGQSPVSSDDLDMIQDLYNEHVRYHNLHTGALTSYRMTQKGFHCQVMDKEEGGQIEKIFTHKFLLSGQICQKYGVDRGADLWHQIVGNETQPIQPSSPPNRECAPQRIEAEPVNDRREPTRIADEEPSPSRRSSHGTVSPQPAEPPSRAAPIDRDPASVRPPEESPAPVSRRPSEEREHQAREVPVSRRASEEIAAPARETPSENNEYIRNLRVTPIEASRHLDAIVAAINSGKKAVTLSEEAQIYRKHLLVKFCQDRTFENERQENAAIRAMEGDLRLSFAFGCFDQ